MAELKAEYALIGSILIDPGCLDAVRGIVTADDFLSEQGRSVFMAACRLADRGQPVDAITVQGLSGVAEAWLVDILDTTPTAAYALSYAEQMRTSSQLRALQALGTDLSGQALEPGTNPTELISMALERLEAVSARQTEKLVDSQTAAMDFMQYRMDLEKGKTATVPTGIPSVDGILGGGMLKTGLYILAARPGVGKTSLGLIVADLAAKKIPVLFVSLEMSEVEIMARRVANISGVGIGAILHNAELSEERVSRAVQALNVLYERHLTINKAASATVAEIGIMARSCRAELVVIDYLGLIRSEGREVSIYERTTKISGDLKRLARSLGCPVLCLAQLNRQSESRTDKRPLISDLRDSGAIEQDADGVLLIHRPAMCWSEKPKAWESQPFEVNIAKNRHGPTGVVTLQWYASNGRFTDKGVNSWL